jgi:anti-sigma regulatory factor (Ser/Thr protein kinase)
VQDVRAQPATPGAGFFHQALVYRDPGEFIAGVLPFLREGLAAAEPVLVAVGPERTAELREALGADAGDVGFLPMRELGRNPARIIPAWRQFLDATAGRRARGIGEPVWAGRGAAELDECQRHEALLGQAFAAPPSWSLLCPYDASALGEEVLATVARTHPHVVAGGDWSASREYVAGRDCFAGALPPAPRGVRVFAFDARGLHEVRSWVGHAARRAGLAMDRAADLVAAASELAANSVAHGGGAGLLRTWPQGNGLVVEVEDAGRLTEPLAGRLRPTRTQEGGRGLWIANQLCDLVQIRSGAGGTVVRLHLAAAGNGAPR